VVVAKTTAEKQQQNSQSPAPTSKPVKGLGGEEHELLIVAVGQRMPTELFPDDYAKRFHPVRGWRSKLSSRRSPWLQNTGDIVGGFTA
jgi:hypothetical protein